MSNIAPHPALYLSPEMVAELALGIDPPLDIAAKYNVSAAELQELQALPWFQEAIYRKRDEFSASGMTFAAKAGMMAEELWQKLYVEAMTTAARTEHKIDIATKLTDIAGLKPKIAAANAGPAGPQFQITINLPSDMQGPSQRKVEARTTAAEPLVLDMTPITPSQDLPPKPLAVADFKLKDDLTGLPLPKGV